MLANSSDFLLFGPLTALRDGKPVPCGGKTERAVLATLLLHAGRPVDVDTMATWVWPPSRLPSDPDHAIQTHIMRLRRHLGPAAVITDGHAYHAANDHDQVDVHRFESAMRKAEGQRRNGRTDDAIRSYGDALQTAGTGLPLPDLAGTAAGMARQAELTEARLDAQERLATLQLLKDDPMLRSWSGSPSTSRSERCGGLFWSMPSADQLAMLKPYGTVIMRRGRCGRWVSPLAVCFKRPSSWS